MQRGLLLVFMFLICSKALFSQTNVNAPRVIPVSPNAASLGKYSEIPVSLYTGIPTIEIPLYTVESGSLKIPLSLSYHAGGVRVEEIASNVGLGWALTGISAVSRTIAGLDDFTPSVGFMNQSTTIDQLLANTNTQALRLDLAKIGARHYDGEPDVYSYSLGKYSGKFYYNQTTHKFVAIPYAAIKIEGDYQNFEITDPEGVRYTLSSLETTNSPENSGSFVGLSNHITTWYISEISDLKTGDKISFEYETYLSRVFLNGSESRTDPIQDGQCNPTGNPATSASIEMREVQSLRIKKIHFKGGYVEFFKSINTRCDLVTDYSLEKIKVLGDDGTLIKDIRLKYSYFQATGKESNPCDEANSRYRRLKLDEIEEVADGKSNNKHKFYYYGDGAIPDRLGYSQDYWGFYNAGSISTNIPAVTYGGVTYPGANRDAVSNLCLIGILNKIVYPTGGKTELEYESNTLKSPVTYNPNNAYYIPFEILDYTNNYYTTDYQQVIEINSPYGYVHELTVGGSGYDLSQIYNNTGNPNISLDYGITLSNSNNPTVDLLAPLVNCNSSSSSGGCRTITQQSKIYKLFNVPNGTYILSGSVAYAEDPYMRSLIVEYLGNLTWFAEITSPEVNGYENKIVGGARLKEEHDYAVNSNAASITKYDYNDDEGFSTAQMQTYPNVEGFLYKSYSDQVLSGTVCKTLRRTSYSSYPLLYTNGSPVGYKKVRKYKIDAQGSKNGIEEFIFTSFDNAQDITVNEVPYCPPVSNDWQRGLMLFKKDYKTENNLSPFKIAETENVYLKIDNSSSNIKGVKVAFVNNVYPWVYEGQEVNSPSDMVQIQSLDMKANTYSLASSVMKQDVVKNIVFSNNLELKEENKYYYNQSTLNIERELRTNSKNEQVNTYRKYTNDFGGTVYADMFNLNILTPVIEVSTFKGLDFLKKQVMNYKEVAGITDNIFVVDEVKTQIKNGPLELDLKFNEYDAAGNLLELQKANDVKKSYLWGYNKQYPVTEVVNAKSNEIFHDNFEELAGWNGNLTAYDNSKSKTGKYSGRIDKPTSGELYSHSTKWLTISLPAAKKFKYSVWVYSTGPSAEIFLFMRRPGDPVGASSSFDQVATGETNKWVLLEKEVTVPADVIQLNVRVDNNGGGTVWFDDVRLHPSDAMMTTYTYTPLVGMTSQTDVNSRSTFYEYDSFNRLSVARDNEGKIIKKICYNYVGQAEDCSGTTYTNVIKSGTFTKNNCGAGATGSSVTYTVAASTYSAATQFAADSLAQNDVNANGQAYANANGTCVYSSYDYSGYYYSELCSSGETPTGVYVNAPAGMFTSTVSLQDANTQAYQYVQNYANTYGSCTSLVDINGYNYSSDNFYVTMTNVSTNEEFYFAIYENTIEGIGMVPPGNYNIQIDSWAGWHSYSVACGNYSYGYSAMFYNIAIDASCNYIEIY